MSMMSVSSSSPLVLSLLASFTALACGGRGSDTIDEDDGGSPSHCIGCDEGEGQSGSSSGDGDGASGDGDSSGDGDENADFGALGFGDFELRPEWDGTCEEVDVVDINRGNTAETAVRAIHCQIFGTEPSAETVETWANNLRTWEHVRRIDVAWSFCLDAGKACDLTFSDPWESQILLEDDCERNENGDVGAVMMYFSECPEGINCRQYWANTHAVGMDSQHALYGYDGIAAGFYTPKNVGWWRREFLDARWSGLDFMLLNTYGPDLNSSDRPVEKAVEALESIDGGIQVALFDDTWGWREGAEPPFNQVPWLAETEGAAKHIYLNKWKPFYDRVPDEHRYKFEGKPLIYFYNAGTLEPRESASGVIRRMKEMFAADFGVEPFVIVDTAFFADEPAMNAVADGRFRWHSFSGPGEEVFTLNDVSVGHWMVRWDSVGRDRGADIATSGDGIYKGPELLQDALVRSANLDLTILATWNDLGEGTGIQRNYDYFHEGEWLAPHHFMSMIRKSRCRE